jgi:hypothetical protein
MTNIAREGFLTRRGQQELEELANDFQEGKRMPLYLDEIYFNISSKEEYKQVCERMTNNMSKGFPPGVTLKAGPWFSNEEPKVILILDIQDHSMTFTPFSNGLSSGAIARRRLTPIVDWATVEKTVKAL